MDFLEMTLEQLKEVVMLPSRDEMIAYLENEGITLPEKVPTAWPADTEKFTRKLWKTIKFPDPERCAEGEHDYQLSGRCEMERNAATELGSCFRKEYRCTKCGATKWESDKKSELSTETEETKELDPAAERAARRAAREQAAAEA